MRRDRRGVVALEFAFCFPFVILFIFGLVAAFCFISARRAMDYGIEKTLRYAVVHSGSSQATLNNVFNSAASNIWYDVGVHGTMVVSPMPYVVGSTVQVTVTYNWTAPATISGSAGSAIFNAYKLTGQASMRAVN